MPRIESLLALLGLTLLLGCGPHDSGGAYDTRFTPPDVDTAQTDATPEIAEVEDVAEVTPDIAPDVTEVTADVGCVDCANGCCDGHCCGLDPNQLPLEDVRAGTRAIVTPQDLVFSTAGDCGEESVLGTCEHVRLNDAIVACVCRVASLTVNGDMQVVGPDVLIVLARDTIEIGGTIDLSAHGSSSGAGGGWSWAEIASGRSGGIGGSLGSLGGGATELLGTLEQEPLTGGCLGQANDTEAGLEGGRGGAIQLSAGKRVHVAGTIRAHGGGGQGGSGGGAGGGSGGGIIIEAPRVIITGKVLANGGGGAGAGGDPGLGGDGEDGQDDRAARGGVGADGSGCVLYGYVSGGDGGAGAFGAEPALMGVGGMSDSRCIGSEAWVGGGGGGGGLGRILIKTFGGCDCVGTFSPVPTLGDVVLR